MCLLTVPRHRPGPRSGGRVVAVHPQRTFIVITSRPSLPVVISHGAFCGFSHGAGRVDLCLQVFRRHCRCWISIPVHPRWTFFFTVPLLAVTPSSEGVPNPSSESGGASVLPSFSYVISLAPLGRTCFDVFFFFFLWACRELEGRRDLSGRLPRMTLQRFWIS